MGHSASIAKKYSPSEESPSRRNRGTAAQTGDDEDQELASVSSYRPTSPAAHSDSRSFTLDTPRRQHREPVGHYSDRSSYHSNRAIVPYVSREPSYTTMSGTVLSYVSSSQNSHFRSMREVRHYIQSNPELLVKKKEAKNRKEKLSGFDDIMASHKQIKTKQRVYLSLISPPVIYAMGARPNDGRLRVNQDVYLNLVYPNNDRRLYQEQVHRMRPPIRHNDMEVIRKEDYVKQQNGQIKRPKAHASQAYSQQMALPQLHHRPQAPSQNRERTLALTRATPRSRQPLPPPGKAPQKAKNDYVSPPATASKRGPQKFPNGQVARQRDWSGKENGNGVVQGSVPQRPMSRQRSNASEATVEFTFNLDDLNLRKKSEVAYSELDKGKVVPLYFRKSLAYSPKYIENDGLLSSPL